MKLPSRLSYIRALSGSSVAAAGIATLAFVGAARAVQYDFLTVAGNNVPGNLASSTFSSNNGNGTIDVRHSFPNGGVGGQDNINTAIYPSQFTSVFPGTGLVDGHLAQTVYNHTSVVTFDLTNYNLSPTTVFGMWNTTDEVSWPAGPGGAGAPVYRMQLIDSGGFQVNPVGLTVVGKQDNTTQVAGRHEMDMNPADGYITPGTLINAGGTHTSATFWENIPAGTKKIIIYADLPPLNTIGDGVGYYFAEVVVPEPASAASVGLLMLLGRRKR